MGSEMTEYSDSKSIHTKSKSNVGTVQASFNLAEQTGDLSIENTKSLRQIKSDIDYAEKLVEITV